MYPERHARKLYDPAVGKRMLSERIGHTGHTLAADNRDFEGLTAARGRDQRHDTRLDEVDKFGRRVRETQQRPTLERYLFRHFHEAVVRVRTDTGELGEQVIARRCDSHRSC